MNPSSKPLCGLTNTSTNKLLTIESETNTPEEIRIRGTMTASTTIQTREVASTLPVIQTMVTMDHLDIPVIMVMEPVDTTDTMGNNLITMEMDGTGLVVCEIFYYWKVIKHKFALFSLFNTLATIAVL